MFKTLWKLRAIIGLLIARFLHKKQVEVYRANVGTAILPYVGEVEVVLVTVSGRFYPGFRLGSEFTWIFINNKFDVLDAMWMAERVCTQFNTRQNLRFLQQTLVAGHWHPTSKGLQLFLERRQQGEASLSPLYRAHKQDIFQPDDNWWHQHHLPRPDVRNKFLKRVKPEIMALLRYVPGLVHEFGDYNSGHAVKTARRWMLSFVMKAYYSGYAFPLEHNLMARLWVATTPLRKVPLVDEVRDEQELVEFGMKRLGVSRESCEVALQEAKFILEYRVTA